jgi:TonB family protein
VDKGELRITSLKEKFRFEPLYTDEARQAGVEGTVVILAEVTSSGFPENLKILKSLGYGLDEAALRAVQNWQFEPRASVSSSRYATLIPLHFELASGSRARPQPPKFLFKAGEEVKPPKILFRVAPSYTEEARDAKLQGMVLVYTEIDAEGNVAAVQVLRDLGKGLGEAASTAIKQWKFQPATRNSMPVAIFMPVEIGFAFGSSHSAN